VRYILSIIILFLCFVGIAGIFWHQEYRYSLPTPVPANYKAVLVGQPVSGHGFDAVLPEGPLFLHFYNPDCPCSRFNARYLKSLIRTYEDSVQLFIVVPSEKAKNKAQREFGADHQYFVDENGKLAATYGVYATPQAVLIDREEKLFYRGNYNKSRYCTKRATNYAELALIALLNNQSPPQFEFSATQSYGCELPNNENEKQFNFY
jgi:hypothetical protein